MPESNAISYASTPNDAKSRSLRRVNVISFIIGGISLGIATIASLGNLDEIRRVLNDAGHRGPAYQDEFKYRLQSAIAILVLSIGFALLSVLLISAARALFKASRSAAVRRYWYYVYFQLLASAALAIVSMFEIYHSSADVLFLFGIVPGLVTSAYPIFLLFCLPRE